MISSQYSAAMPVTRATASTDSSLGMKAAASHEDGDEGGEFERHQEQQDGISGESQNPAGQSLPVQHEGEGAVHQYRSYVRLKSYQSHGDNDDGGHLQKVGGPGKVEAVGAHDPGKAEGGGYLGELGGLDGNPSGQAQPGLGTVYLVPEDQYGYQEYRRQDVQGPGYCLVEPGVEEQDNDGHHRRRTYPQQLVAAARGQGEYSLGLLAPGRGIDVQPAEDGQQDVAADQDPVQFLICLSGGTHQSSFLGGT